MPSGRAAIMVPSLPVMTELMVHTERITFRSEGVELVGELRGAETGDRRPAVALTGPFTGVKEQVTGTYAELLALAGFVTLAFDHRGFGKAAAAASMKTARGNWPI